MSQRQAIILEKTPAMAWDVMVDWASPARQLGGDIIASSAWQWTGPEGNLELYDESVAEDGKSATTWIKGGTVGDYYIIVNTITTEAGRTLQESFLLHLVANIFLSQTRCL